MGTGSDFLSKVNPLNNFGGGGGFLQIAMAIIIGTVSLGVVAGVIWYFIKKKKSWNIKVEFRLPRDLKKIEEDDGSERIIGTIKKVWGKGYYSAKEGVVYVKRKGTRAVAMKPFNIKEFLSDSSILTVIQVGLEDYRPVLEDSYLEVIDYDTGEEGALIKAKIDTSESKSWKNTYERERLSTYTLLGWMHQHGQLIGFGFILLCILVGFAIVYGKIT